MGSRDVIIIGGGLAGLTAAIHLSGAGLRVAIIEKNTYPQHKVCGEYISNEVLPYLQWLGADPVALQPSHINRLLLSDQSGNTVEGALEQGGFGVSRYRLDQFLMEKALVGGAELLTDTVTNVRFEAGQFFVDTVQHGILTAPFVLGAYGKRSALDQKLSRPFMAGKSAWLAVKGHYQGDFPDHLVALHNFAGGYCGVSKIENDIINVCYLVHYDTFKRYKNIAAHQEAVLYKNIHLKTLLTRCTPLFDRPMSISQVSFAAKESVTAHMLMTGDTAGLIHPFCGNGMAMAIHSAGIAATLLLQYFDGAIAGRALLEEKYTQAWQELFAQRMQTGRILSRVFRSSILSAGMLKGLLWFPGILPAIIKRTHGKPLNVNV
ncbi:NAD(P)/FAD-dependent oxidoreductase [Chitinophaga nivalis]|uniref:NAD(P)/FAD-dependent oxidoreductase n=1 Tax=Chitinophaga nivalis TaxID=2991709 RepID=A0ABT3IHY6_9BACT|nr:NAD(P)/FAD-dependent oxidoreductase [Chitinophaga nivalis]MCW3466751.1 NAD(P)/FAD-dependent oxidoreductase [Chitinophaga nivalis]MCW3483558.1 NAD(P)/FAD-dependent oxidoreductase [Chitinophaga nivalis]